MKGNRAMIELLLRILDDAYEKHAWHGPNLTGSLRGVTPAQAKADEMRIRKTVLQHRQLRATIADLRSFSAREERQIYGVAFHDVYHAGQIQALKRLQRRR